VLIFFIDLEFCTCDMGVKQNQ